MMIEKVGRFLSGGEVADPNGLLLIHLNIFIYALCFWIQQPVLPYLSEELGADAVEFGTLQSAVSFMSLFGGTMMGRMTDKYGAKTSIMISHLGSFVMYGLTGVAFNFTILFLSRIPALFQHAMMCAQAAISQVALVENRSTAMGRLSLSYALGMVGGSPLGGIAAETIGYHGTALFSTGLTLVILVLDLLYLPDFKKKKAASEKQEEQTNLSFTEEMKEVWKVLTSRNVANLLFFTFPISMGIGSVRSMLPLAGKENFGMESKDLGIYIAYAAIVGLLANVFIIASANKHLGEYKTCILTAAIQAVGYGMYPFISSYNELLLLTIPTTVASTLLYTLSSSLMSLAVDEKHTGTAISISHGSRSLVGILAPLVGGFVYQLKGLAGLGSLASVTCLLSMILALMGPGNTLTELEKLKKQTAKKKSK